MQYNMLLLFVKDKLQVVCLVWVDGGEKAGALGAGKGCFTRRHRSDICGLEDRKAANRIKIIVVGGNEGETQIVHARSN